jgi:hypothetical protein
VNTALPRNEVVSLEGFLIIAPAVRARTYREQGTRNSIRKISA